MAESDHTALSATSEFRFSSQRPTYGSCVVGFGRSRSAWASGDSMKRDPGQRSRARDVWRWCSLLPCIGAVPGCVVMAKRGRRRWAFSAGAVTALWFALIAVPGPPSPNGGGSTAAATAVGLGILVLSVVQIIVLFCAPATKSVGR